MTKLKNQIRVFSQFAVIGFSLSLVACATSSPVRDPASSHTMNMSADAVSCTQWSDRVSPAQQNVIDEVMGNREHRMHHALWHAARGGFSPEEKTEVLNTFGQSWNELHSLCPAPGADAHAQKYNPAGEDFLYMHRDMVNHLRTAFIAKGLACVKGFDHVPTTQEWPLPDNTRTGAKSDEALAQLQAWDKKFHNRNWLKSVTLSQMGWALEFTIHNNIHMRFATDQPPAGFEGVTETGGAPIPYNGNFPDGWAYDQAKYNWLADPYGAALNPTFWKIHGYVDHLIDLWLAANEYRSIDVDCNGKAACYQWQGQWEGVLNISKSLPGKIGSRPAGRNDDDATIQFNQKRMRMQHVGVLGETRSVKAGGPRGRDDADPNDPIAFTNQRLCGSAH